MSVHYDVEKTIADMKQASAHVVLPGNALPVSHVIQRNRGIFFELWRLMLAEDNRHTPVPLQVRAVAHVVAEYIDTMGKSYKSDKTQSILNVFDDQVNKSLTEIRDGRTHEGARTKVTMEKAGHA